MNFDFSDDVKQVRDHARGFLRDECPPSLVRRSLDGEAPYSEHLWKEIANAMIRQGTGGRIVGIASVDGQRASPMRGAYGAAKAGLISVVQTMAVEWAPHGISVNAIAPGHIVTPRLFDTPARVEGYSNSLIPMRRRGTTDDIGKAALFLLSDLAAYVNGTTLDVDGGLLSANLFPMGLPASNG